MNDYLKIKGLGRIVLLGEPPENGKDYILSIRIARSGVSKDEKDIENPVETYLMEYLNTEQLQEIGKSTTIKVQKGKTRSQALRFTIEDLARQEGIDEEVFYNQELSKIIEHYRGKLDDKI